MKTCDECGVSKPLSKFYRHPWEQDGYMARCKFCHNGGQELKRRQEEFFSERQLGDPSEESIRFQCERIQAGWTEKQRARRRRKVGVL